MSLLLHTYVFVCTILFVYSNVIIYNRIYGITKRRQREHADLFLHNLKPS